MSEIISSVVRRNFREVPRFVFTSTSSEATPGELALEPNEQVIGSYTNPPPWESSWVVLSTIAIYTIEDGTVTRIPWETVEDFETPQSKVAPVGVRLRTRDGIRFVRMAGSSGPDGKYKDAYSLTMVLRALLQR